MGNACFRQASWRCRETLLKDQKFDYLFFDTSPGLQYSSINAIVAADFVVVATTGDRSDVDGTKRMLAELYNLFEKKTGLVLNKVLDASATARKLKCKTKLKKPIKCQCWESCRVSAKF